MMHGDLYQVFYSLGGETFLHDVFNTWAEAKAARNDLFYSRTNMRAVWIMRINPSLNLRQEPFGNAMRRTKHEIKP